MSFKRACTAFSNNFAYVTHLIDKLFIINLPLKKIQYCLIETIPGRIRECQSLRKSIYKYYSKVNTEFLASSIS